MSAPLILILNGPNLNFLGTREPHIYGHTTLADIETSCRELANQKNCSIEFKQSNHEGQLIDWIQSAQTGYAGLIINAAAYTHTSIAIHDALKLLIIPIAEVHLSNPKAREEFRHHSYIEPVAQFHFSGHGAQSYTMALDSIIFVIQRN
jgi:3-dehydroquinate dehydratase-2